MDAGYEERHHPPDPDRGKRPGDEFADTGRPQEDQDQAKGRKRKVAGAELKQRLGLLPEEQHADPGHEPGEYDVRHVGDVAADSRESEPHLDGAGHDDDDRQFRKRHRIVHEQCRSDHRKHRSGSAHHPPCAAAHGRDDPHDDAAPQPGKGSHAGDDAERHGDRHVGCQEDDAGF